MYTQGEIVLVPFPFTDQKGNVKRPALVVSNNAFNNSSPDIILVQITKQQNDDGNSIGVSRNDLTVPLNHISEIRCHKILVAKQSIIIKHISNLRHNKVQQVIAKIHSIIS